MAFADQPLFNVYRYLYFHAFLPEGIAVTGGALLSQYISEKVIGYIGGTLFVVFSITTAIGIF